VALVIGTTVGGVGRHVRSLAEGLAGLGARVVVFGPAQTDEAFGFGAAGASFRPVRISDRPHPAGDARTLATLARALRDADVVHAHGLRAGGLAAMALTRVVPGPVRLGRSGPPLAVTLHNAVIAGGVTAKIYGLLERLVARRADLVLGVSPDLVERMRGLGARWVETALVPAPEPAARPAGGTRAELRAELGVGERPLVFCAVRLAGQKGLPYLLDAAAGWGRRTPPPLVAVAGAGPLEAELSARIEAEGLPVRLLGQRPDAEALMAAADVLVLPSVWEGQPLVLHEMLRSGRPIVATRVGGVPVMTGEDAALLVPAKDPEALREAVERVLDDPDLAAGLGTAAARRAAELPGERDAVAQIAGLYRRLAG
jgi:glycosyltransferase involved in cell wall biosynthesis